MFESERCSDIFFKKYDQNTFRDLIRNMFNNHLKENPRLFDTWSTNENSQIDTIFIDKLAGKYFKNILKFLIDIEQKAIQSGTKFFVKDIDSYIRHKIEGYLDSENKDNRNPECGPSTNISCKELFRQKYFELVDPPYQINSFGKLKVRGKSPSREEEKPARQQVKFEVYGEEMLEKEVKYSGNSWKVYLPLEWIGKRIKVIRIN